MLQQNVAEKSHHRLAFLESLSASQTDKREHEKILSLLSDDYSAAVRLAANLSSHSKWIPYPFLLNRLKDIADGVRGQAELIRGAIVRLGGTIPQVASETRDDVDFRQNIKRLVGDMEAHASRSELLVHQKNSIRDATVAALLGSVASDMQNQRQELLDIVMRLS